MFKNPLKYQIGGPITPDEARKQVVSFISQITGAKEDEINPILDKIGQDEEASKQLSQILQLANDGKEEGIKALKQIFNPSKFKEGGKINSFICKFGKGGVNCGCIKKAQEGTKFYNENGVELPNGPIYKEGRRGYVVFPTQEGRVAKYLNELNNNKEIEYWKNPPLPINQSISKFRMAASADYPAIYVPTNFAPNEQAEAMAKIARWQPQDKPWNGVERQQAGGQIINGPAISREDALDVAANSLYNGDRSLARIAYQNAKNALRNQGLRGNNLRNEARAMIMGLNNLPIIDDSVPENVISSNDLDVKYEVTPNGNVPIFKDLDSSINIQPAKPIPVYNLSNFSDEELANRVIAGEYGNGAARRNALGDRYSAVQRIINSRLKRPVTIVESPVDNSSQSSANSNNSGGNFFTTTVQGGKKPGFWKRLFTAMTDVSEGTSPHLYDRAAAVENEDKDAYRATWKKEAEDAAIASSLQGLAFGAMVGPLTATSNAAVTTSNAANTGRALVPVGKNAVTAGKAVYETPNVGWQIWKGADGQWIGQIGNQLFKNGSKYFPLATLKIGGKIKKD